MTILAFDTATAFGAVCGLASGSRAREPRAGDLLAAVDRLVGEPAEIERIVVGRGPGSFTSIRIGLAMARSLALTLDVPVAQRPRVTNAVWGANRALARVPGLNRIATNVELVAAAPVAPPAT